jgi:hypothetical protein
MENVELDAVVGPVSLCNLILDGGRARAYGFLHRNIAGLVPAARWRRQSCSACGCRARQASVEIARDQHIHRSRRAPVGVDDADISRRHLLPNDYVGLDQTLGVYVAGTGSRAERGCASADIGFPLALNIDRRPKRPIYCDVSDAQPLPSHIVDEADFLVAQGCVQPAATRAVARVGFNRM